MDYKNDDSIEKEILESRNDNDSYDDDVRMIRARNKQKRRSFVDKVDNLSTKNFKKRRIFLALICAIVIGVAFLISGSFALKSDISKTNNTYSLEAGTLKLEFANESEGISMNNAIPQTNKDALLNNKEYKFTVKNTGNVDSEYTISLDNSCTTNQNYKIDNKTVRPDICIPDKYIKVGLSTNGNDYKVLKRVENDNTYILETGVLAPNTKNDYKLKIWLTYETPNTYNSNGSNNIVYSGNVNLNYKQISKSDN